LQADIFINGVLPTHTKDSEYSLPTPSCKSCLERRSLFVRSGNQNFFFVRKMQVF